jgi:hypothetical protein
LPGFDLEPGVAAFEPEVNEATLIFKEKFMAKQESSRNRGLADQEPSRIRVQIDFAPGAFEELLELQDRTGAPSRGETLKYALRTLQWLSKAVDDNGTLVIEKNGQRERLVFPFLQRSGVTVSVP